MCLVDCPCSQAKLKLLQLQHADNLNEDHSDEGDKGFVRMLEPLSRNEGLLQQSLTLCLRTVMSELTCVDWLERTLGSRIGDTGNKFAAQQRLPESLASLLNLLKTYSQLSPDEGVPVRFTPAWARQVERSCEQ